MAHVCKRARDITPEEWAAWDWHDVTALGDVAVWDDWDSHVYVRGLPTDDDGTGRMMADGRIVRHGEE